MSTVKATQAWPAAGQPFTTDELDRMPDDGRRYEVLDGALVVSPRPGGIHQEVAARLAAVLHDACPDGMFVTSGPAVRLSRTAEFTPDITVARQRHPAGSKLTEAPLLAVEVRPFGAPLIDLDGKKAAYQAFGVESYWIVVPDTRRPKLTVFELVGNSYEQLAQVIGDDAFRARRPFAVEVIPARLVARLHPAQPSPAKISMCR